MKILAIETSCDETSIAIIDMKGSSQKPHLAVLSHIISSQIKIHEKFGGVVPNLAAREHQKNLVSILIRALKESRFLKSKLQNPNYKQITKSKLQKLEKILEREQELFARIREHILPLKTPNVDAIAVTIGPGLEPALWVGINFAKALSFLWDKPIIPVNHMEGHIYSALLQQSRVKSKLQNPNYKKILNYKFQMPKFPAAALLVSGGHTELVLVKGIGKYKIIGETLDDAAGEAFDKVARLLGLPYPGGPAISALAEMEIRSTKSETDPTFKILNSKFQIQLPRPMIHSKDLNFSFSGLKTAVLYLIKDLERKYDIKKLRPVIAQEFQNAVVEVLVSKTMKAAKKYKAKTILLGGGVAANKLLRKELARNAKMSRVELLTSPLSLTSDNALMSAVAAFFRKKKARKNISLLRAQAHLRLS